MKTKIGNDDIRSMENENDFSLRDWTVSGHIATHTSGITATATSKFSCNLDLSPQHNLDEEVDVGQLTADALLLVIEGKLTEAPQKEQQVVYEIPKEIRSQYRSHGLAFAAVKANKLRKIVYLRDVMPEEIHSELLNGDCSQFAQWRQTEQAKRIFQANSLLGEIKFGYCANLQFIYVPPDDVTADFDDDSIF